MLVFIEHGTRRIHTVGSPPTPPASGRYTVPIRASDSASRTLTLVRASLQQIPARARSAENRSLSGLINEYERAA